MTLPKSTYGRPRCAGWGREPAGEGGPRKVWASASGGAQGLLVPGDVPVAAELPALLREMRDLLEAEPFVQCDRGRVRQRDAGVCPMDVLAEQRGKQAPVQPRAHATTDRLARDVDADLDRRLVCGLGPEATAGRVADDASIRDRDHHAIPAASAVVAEPLLPPLQRGRLQIECGVRLDNVLVVDIVERPKVVLRRGSHHYIDRPERAAHGLRVHARQSMASTGAWCEQD